MGPYGSVGAHIKTGKRSMAPDHFQTPPDPKKGYKNQKQIKKRSKKTKTCSGNTFHLRYRGVLLVPVHELAAPWSHIEVIMLL